MMPLERSLGPKALSSSLQGRLLRLNTSSGFTETGKKEGCGKVGVCVWGGETER